MLPIRCDMFCSVQLELDLWLERGSICLVFIAFGLSCGTRVADDNAWYHTELLKEWMGSSRAA
jgi:hypothetical protein